MKIGFLFSGYGSQYLGMGKELYDNFRIVQELFEEASNCLNINFVRLCFASSEAELNKPENAFVAIFLLQASIVAVLREKKVFPDLVFGYELGDYGALHAALGITFPDALYLLTKYAQYYKNCLSNIDLHAVEIKGVSVAEIKKYCKQLDSAETLDISIIYDATTCVVTGSSEALNQLKEDIDEFDPKVSLYDNTAGLYSPQMKTVIAQLKMYLEKVDFKDISIPCHINIESKSLLTSAEIKKHFFEQLGKPLSWHKRMHKMRELDIIIQIGPNTQLTEKVKNKYAETKEVIILNKLADFHALQCILTSYKPLDSQKSEIKYGTI